MADMVYQTNSIHKDRVDGFFRSLGLDPQYEALDEPPASGYGSLVRITVPGFDPFSLRGEQLRQWREVGKFIG